MEGWNRSIWKRPCLPNPIASSRPAATKCWRRIAKKIPRAARFIGYGTRVSFGYVTRDALEQNAEAVVKNAAADVTAWNQRGCLSPHVIYVEDGGKVTADAFAALLAGQLDAVEKTFPRGPLNATEAAAIAMRRSFYEVRSAHSLETKMWASPESTAWTVILENDPRFQVSCANRFIYIKAAADLTQALQGVERGARQSVNHRPGRRARPDARNRAASGAAGARAGFVRWARCKIRRWPGGTTDARALGDLVTWTDWEKKLNYNYIMELRKTFQFETAHLLPYLPQVAQMPPLARP